jgi:hypothetical protein
VGCLQVTVRKGDSIGVFLKAVREQLAPQFRELRAVSVDNMMYIKVRGGSQAASWAGTLPVLQPLQQLLSAVYSRDRAGRSRVLLCVADTCVLIKPEPSWAMQLPHATIWCP